ncbi:DUF5677 domain-containing protein [Bacillus mycoides]|uniref:DUF5677 domain-containing protein n=1 Tax=Bacillus mycoides TaxID=1405 RepID=UPI001C5D17B9|nr:DUF5677 domain-containing protein [Bacillus mycoides]
MDETELEAKIYDLANQSGIVLKEIFEVCSPLYRQESEVPIEVQEVISNLYISCYMSSESVLLLIENCRLWDAEILLRSICEGTIKILYMCTGKEYEIRDKVKEFWDIAPRLKRIPNHYKAVDVLSRLDDGSIRWEPIRKFLLAKEELDILQEKFPKKIRRQIEQKWSFNEMIRDLSNNNNNLDMLISLFYGYSIGSHFMHQDSDALKLIIDRNERDEQRRIFLELAHASREISDVLNLAFIRSFSYFKLCNLDTTPLMKVKEKSEWLFEQMSRNYDEWHSVEYK